jgi:putative transposase
MRHPLHDYTQAAGYFVTTVTADREPLLGYIRNGVFSASAYGKIVDKVWTGLPSRFEGLVCDALQLMPDHLHGILIITHLPGAQGAKPTTYSLPQVMQALKSISSRQINLLRGVTGVRVWQEGYHDRIIRSDKELEKYRNFLVTNPLRTIISG